MDSPVTKEKKGKKDKKEKAMKGATDDDGASSPSSKKEKVAKEKKEKKLKSEVSIDDDGSPVKKEKVKRKKSPSSPTTPANAGDEVKPKRVKKIKKVDTSPGGGVESPLVASSDTQGTPRPKKKKAPPAPILPSEPSTANATASPLLEPTPTTTLLDSTVTPSPKKKRSKPPKPKTQLELDLENMPLPPVPSQQSGGGVSGLDAFLTKSSVHQDLDDDLIAALGNDELLSGEAGSGAVPPGAAAAGEGTTPAVDDDQDVMDMLNNLTNFEKRASKPKPKGKKAPKRATSASPAASPRGDDGSPTDGSPTPPASPRPKGKKKMVKKAPPPTLDGGDGSPTIPSPAASPPGVRPARKKRPSPSPGTKAAAVSPPAALSAPPLSSTGNDTAVTSAPSIPPPFEAMPMPEDLTTITTHIDDNNSPPNGEEVSISLTDYVPGGDDHQNDVGEEGGGHFTDVGAEDDTTKAMFGDDYPPTATNDDDGGTGIGGGMDSKRPTISTSNNVDDEERVNEHTSSYAIPPTTTTTTKAAAPITPITTPTSLPLSRVSSFGSTSRRDRVVTFSNVLDDRTGVVDTTTHPPTATTRDNGVLEPMITATNSYPPTIEDVVTPISTPTASYQPSRGSDAFVLEPLERSSSGPPTPIITTTAMPGHGDYDGMGGSPSSMLLSPTSVSATIDRGVKAHTTGAANLARTPTRQVDEAVSFPHGGYEDDSYPHAADPIPQPSFGGGGGVLEEIVTSAPHTRSTSPTAYEQDKEAHYHGIPTSPPTYSSPPPPPPPPPPTEQHNDEPTNAGKGGAGVVGVGGGDFEHFFKDAYDDVHVSLSPDQQRSPSLPPPPPAEEDYDIDGRRGVSPTVLAIIEEEPYNPYGGGYAPDKEGDGLDEYDNITVSALSSPYQRSVRGATAPEPFGLSPLLSAQDHPLPPVPHHSGMYLPQRGPLASIVPYAVSDITTSIECSEEPMRKSTSPPSSSYPDYKQLGPWPVLHHSPPHRTPTKPPAATNIKATAPTLDHVTQAAANKGAECNLNTTFNEFLSSFTKPADASKPDTSQLRADRLHPMHSANRQRNMEASTAPLFTPRTYPKEDEDLIELLRDALQPSNSSSPTAKTAKLDSSLTHSWGVLKKKLRNSLVKQSKLRAEIRQWDSNWGLGDTLKSVRSDGSGEDASDPLRAVFADDSPMSTSSAQLLLRTKTALKRRRVATRAQKEAMYDAFLFMLGGEDGGGNGSMMASTSPEDILSNLFGITEVVSLSP